MSDDVNDTEPSDDSIQSSAPEVVGQSNLDDSLEQDLSVEAGRSPGTIDQPNLPKWPFFLAGAMIFLAILVAASMAISVPYYAFSPGPVYEIDELVQVENPDPVTGELYMLTVQLAEISALEFVVANLDSEVDLYQRERIRPVDQDPDEYAERQRVNMDESKTIAIYLALNELGYDVEISGSGVLVGGFAEGSPVEGILEVDDVITKVDDAEVFISTDLIGLIRDKEVGDEVVLVVERDGEEITKTVTLVEHVDDPSRPMVGFLASTSNWSYSSPVDIQINDENIGGPSAGLMYTITIMDLLSEDDLSRGYIIAGTGTIEASGGVGSIGGIRQKVVAATEAGAEYILVPSGNYEDAQTVETDVPLVEVSSLADALTFLGSLDPKIQ